MLPVSEIPLVVTIFIGLATLICSVTITTIYDLKIIKKTKDIDKHKNSRKLRYRPKISIVAYSYNQAKYIPVFLQSIKNGNYRKYQLIIVDDFSSDESIEVVRKFIDQWPKNNIRIIQRKSHFGISNSITYAIKKYTDGELIFVTSVARKLQNQALKNIANDFNVNKNIKLLKPNVTYCDAKSMSSVFASFLSLIKNDQNKIASVFRKTNLVNLQDIVLSKKIFGTYVKLIDSNENDSFAINTVNLHGKDKYFSQSVKLIDLGSKNLQSLLRVIFLESIRVSRNILFGNFVQKINSLKTILLLSIPLFYFWFFAYSFFTDNSVFFLLGWFFVLVHITFSLWSNNGLNNIDKLRLSIFIPIIYLLFIIYGLTVLVSYIIYQLTELPKIFLKSSTIRVLNNKPSTIKKVKANTQLSKSV